MIGPIVPLVDAPTLARLDAALAGRDEAKRLDVAALEVDAWGVLDVSVDQVHPARPFARKRGGEGLVGRVALRDTTGVIDMVLWDDENRLTVDGPLAPGTRLLVRGATVKAGWKGGLELGLGSAVLEPHPTPGATIIKGTLLERSTAQVVGDPPRTKLEVQVEVGGDRVTVVCWDDAIRDVQVEIGQTVRIQAVPHPALDGYYIA